MDLDGELGKRTHRGFIGRIYCLERFFLTGFLTIAGAAVSIVDRKQVDSF